MFSMLSGDPQGSQGSGHSSTTTSELMLTSTPSPDHRSWSRTCKVNVATRIKEEKVSQPPSQSH